MGVIAESMVAYMQPLLDQTDGSADQMKSAFALGQICWNLALLPQEELDETLSEMRPSLKMADDEFAVFRSSVIAPMIRRHQEMFPRMHRLGSMGQSSGASTSQTGLTKPVRTEKYPGIGRNARCPCKSGKKYKLCCGR